MLAGFIGVSLGASLDPPQPAPLKPGQPATASGNDASTADDLDISTEDSTGITWYRPRFEFWQIEDFKVYPSIGIGDAGERRMILTIVVKDPPGGRPEAVHIDGGKEPWIIPISDPEAVVTHDSGCRVTQTITLQRQAEAVLNLGESQEVEVSLTGFNRPLRYRLSTGDLDGIRRLARLWAQPTLPVAAPKPTGSGPGKAGVGWTNPEIIKSSKVQPRFPKRAQGKQALGRVVLQALIHKDGTVGEITVVRGAGGDCGFEAAAVEALSHWRYKPGTVDGTPVDIWFTVEIDFTYGNYRIAH